MLNVGSDLRPGASVESHALVLSVLSLKEADRLVHLLTPQWGIITTVATQAARSQKRFGAALEPLNHIKAHLRVPRDPRATENPFWPLSKAELQDSFLHFRRSFALLESAFFVLRLVKDFSPDAAGEAPVFKALGRFLRDSGAESPERYPTWLRVIFWTWFTHHLGFGDLSLSLSLDRGDVGEFFRDPTFAELWHRSLAPREPEFKALFSALKELSAPPLGSEHEARLYEHWLKLSGIHWSYFEQWLSTKHIA